MIGGLQRPADEQKASVVPSPQIQALPSVDALPPQPASDGVVKFHPEPSTSETADQLASPAALELVNYKLRVIQ